MKVTNRGLAPPDHPIYSGGWEVFTPYRPQPAAQDVETSARADAPPVDASTNGESDNTN